VTVEQLKSRTKSVPLSRRRLAAANRWRAQHL